MNWFVCTLTFAALFTASAAAPAVEWPEFRGPTGQGHTAEDRLPLEWGPKNNIAWKQPIPGLGWSSPIVWQGRVYLTTAIAAEKGKSVDQSLHALCLDAASGKQLWTTEVFFVKAGNLQRTHSKNSHASPTPLTDGVRLYVHFGHMGTACLDLSGKVLWRQTELSYSPVHGNGGSPILAGDSLIFSCDGSDKQFLVALETATGKVRWKTDRKSQATKKFSFSTPQLITVEGRPQVISPASDMVCGYDPATGKEIWRVRYEGYSVIPRPVYGHGLVYIITGYDTPQLLAIRVDGQGDVTESHIAWTAKRAVPHSASLLLVGDELYMVSDLGVASCLDAKSGTVHWQERLGGGFSASPLGAPGRIYFQNEEGQGTVLKAGRQFEKLATNALKERTLASYAVADKAIFLRTDQHLYRIEQVAKPGAQ